MKNINIPKKIKLALWFVPINSSLKPISEKELNWKIKLSKNRFFQFHHSRGYVREALSNLWGIEALEIPLIAPPGKPPKLKNKFGNISFSHCIDGLLIGWSNQNIGVDIERIDRQFEAKTIYEKFFANSEKELLRKCSEREVRQAVLNYWVRKEAAIKWQKGSIYKDIHNWIFEAQSNSIINRKDEISLYSYFTKYKSWYISIATKIQMPNMPSICVFN